MLQAVSSVMRSLVILSVFTLAFYSARISGKLHYGEGYVNLSGDEDYKCKVFSFGENSGATNNVHVQLRLRLNAYQAAVSWIESISSIGFTGCVAISGPATAENIHLTWVAFEPSDVSGVGLTRAENIPMWTTGTKCVDVHTGETFSSAPLVFMTVIHTNPPKNVHDATSVWAEEVTNLKFKVCLRKLKNFDGVHENIKVNVLAVSSMPGNWPIPIGQGVTVPTNYIPNEDTQYSFCKLFYFPKPFYSEPKVVTTSAHDKNTIEPDNNAISEWVKLVTKETFTVCLKDIQRYDANHDPVTVNYMAIGNIHPCYNVKCDVDRYCHVHTATMTYTCECKYCKDEYYSQQVCDTDDVTHNSRCELEREICLGTTTASWQHNGACQPFVSERGRVALRLNTTDVQCKLVYFSYDSFQSSEGRINVQTSINYFNSTGGFIHDAAVTWVEKVNYGGFKVCALKAGRAERVTPDSGVTFVDYFAFQETPAGAASGHLLMPSKWWDGTTCTSLTFQNGLFSSTPYVFLTAEHSVLGQKHDAATVWVENVSSNGLKACLREMQNFDGLHENITVNWVAYESLEKAAKLNINQQTLDFPNDEQPKLAYHNAFCQDKNLGKYYSSTPTIIVSAAHSSGEGSDNVIPEYNSIASWVESINSTYYRLCVKEIHNPNGYDPVKVTTLIIGS